jgi:hypothetical protein
MHLTKRLALTSTALLALAAAPSLVASPVKFRIGMHFDFGSLTAYDPDPTDDDEPGASGYFVIDDQLVDQDPNPDSAIYTSFALVFIETHAGSFKTTGNFYLGIQPDDAWIDITGPWGGIYFDYSEKQPDQLMKSFADLLDPTFNQLSGAEGYLSIAAGQGYSDNASGIHFQGAYTGDDWPSSSPTVPDGLGVLPLAAAVTLAAAVKQLAPRLRRVRSSTTS